MVNLIGHRSNGDDGSFQLYVEDDGPGFDWQQVTKQSSGLKIVQLLARQLRGRIEVTRDPLNRCSVRYKQDRLNGPSTAKQN